MTLGTTTVGGAAVGSVESTIRLASLPARTLSVSRPGVVTAEQRGGVGGTALGGGAVGSTVSETSTNAVPVRSSGVATASVASRGITLTRGVTSGGGGAVGGASLGGAAVGSTTAGNGTIALTATGIGVVPATLPNRQLVFTRDGVPFRGVGVAELSVAPRHLRLSRTTPTATGSGLTAVSPPSRTLTLTRDSVGLAGSGVATVTIPERALTLMRAVPGVSLRVAVPSRTLTLSRDGDEQDFETGGVGGVGVGGGTIGGTATESLANALPTDYFGSVDVSLPSRTLTLSRDELTAAYLLSVPSRTLTLSRATPPATGIGTATAAPPTRVLTLRRGAPRIGYTEWVVAGNEVTNIITETATPERLSLTSRVSRPTLRDVVRPLRSDEGKYRVFADDSGGYRAVDTADGNNTFVINAPIGRVPLRPLADEYHVDRYEEEIVETTGDEWDVTLELVPDATRDDDSTVDETPTVSEYAFETVNGTIATDRVDADVTGVGEGGVDRATLTLKLTFDQAYALETALAQNRGTRVRTIEDGTNRAVDETADGSNTLTITSPDEDTLPSGEYVVVEPFESTRLNDSWQVVEVEIVPTA